MANILGTLKGIFGFGKKEGNLNSIERMLAGGNFRELTEEEQRSIVAPGVVQEVKSRRLIEVIFNRTETKEGFNKLFHYAIVKLSDGEIIDPQKVSGDTAVEIGYHPAGYSMWNTEVHPLQDGTFFVKWNSFNTCD